MKGHPLAIVLVFLSLGVLASEKGNRIHLDYQWECSGKLKKCSLTIDRDLLDYYRNDRIHICYRYESTPFDSPSNYSSFLLSENDRKLIRDLVKQPCFNELTDYRRIQAALTFVQSLTYMTDEESRGVDEYVRYPVETLVDGVGDCEDKVILLAAMLKEMGIDFILFSFPNHMALGVRCDSMTSDQYVQYGDRRYYYLETTAPNWEIGQVPRDYTSQDIKIVPYNSTPVLVTKSQRFETGATWSGENANCIFRIQLFNMGPGKATGVNVRVLLMDNRGKNTAVLADERFKLTDFSEGESREEQLQFMAQLDRVDEMRVVLSYDNVPSQEFVMKLKSRGRGH